MPAIHARIPGCHVPGDYDATPGWERFFIGVDVAQTRDFSSLSFLHCRQEPLMSWGRDGRQLLSNVQRRVRRVERLRQGLSYVDVGRYLHDLAQRPALLGDALFIVDVSGVGRGLASILGELGVDFMGVTMTAGESFNRGPDGFFRVGKAYLLGTMTAAIETGQMAIVKDAHGTDELRREMEDFQVEFTRSGQLTANAKSGSHDDTIISTALAYFGSEIEGGAHGPSRLIGWR
jgi:hypothetical protein